MKTKADSDNKESILKVDDEEDACQVLGLIFNKAGYITETVQTGKKTFKKVHERSYNIAFLDIRLPNTDGIQLITPLKELPTDMVVMMIKNQLFQLIALRTPHIACLRLIQCQHCVRELFMQHRE